jgi:predicted metal-binding protein
MELILVGIKSDSLCAITYVHGTVVEFSPVEHLSSVFHDLDCTKHPTHLLNYTKHFTDTEWS